MIMPALRFSALSMPNSLILEQSNPGGRARKSMDLARGLYFWLFFAEGAAVPRTNGLAAKSASETPVMQTSRPAKTRRLKKAEFEVEFFFIFGYAFTEVRV